MFMKLEEWNSVLDKLEEEHGNYSWALVTFRREFATLHLDTLKEEGNEIDEETSEEEPEKKKPKGVVTWIQLADEDFCNLFNENAVEYKEFVTLMCSLNGV